MYTANQITDSTGRGIAGGGIYMDCRRVDVDMRNHNKQTFQDAIYTFASFKIVSKLTRSDHLTGLSSEQVKVFDLIENIKGCSTEISTYSFNSRLFYKISKHLCLTFDSYGHMVLYYVSCALHLDFINSARSEVRMQHTIKTALTNSRHRYIEIDSV